MEQLQFVNVTYCKPGRSKNKAALGVSEEDRRRIRIQVQRDFRRKEKQRLSNASTPQYTGPPSASDPQSVKEASETPDELLSVVARLPPSQIPNSVNSPNLWLDSLARSMAEDCYPRDHGSMHVLENNVAYSYHMQCDAPMLAIREALSCLHVGSTLGHESILHEGIKRYVRAINCLREDAAQKKPKMTVYGLSMVGMGILLCQVRYFVLLMHALSFDDVRCKLKQVKDADFSRRNMLQCRTARPRIHGKVTSQVYPPLYQRTSSTLPKQTTRRLGIFWSSR